MTFGCCSTVYNSLVLPVCVEPGFKDYYILDKLAGQVGSSPSTTFQVCFNCTMSRFLLACTATFAALAVTVGSAAGQSKYSTAFSANGVHTPSF